MNGHVTGTFTVYYVVGQPRSGSTFVGDWIARDRNILNAGEVWQTFRSLGQVHEPGFETGTGRWARPAERAAKNAEIMADPFWSQVAAGDAEQTPYARLLHEARTRGDGLVDCSKTDSGLQAYLNLGCRVVVVHTVRAFGTWSASMRKYHQRHDLPPVASWRLLQAYVRINRRLAMYRGQLPYHCVPQERLADLQAHLDLSSEPSGPAGGYQRAEMFGTPNFTGTFEASRATSAVAPADRMLYILAGARI